jgi:hypothetical protein
MMIEDWKSASALGQKGYLREGGDGILYISEKELVSEIFQKL